jgi:hypothetical protein
MRIFLIFLLFSSVAKAFTLNTNFNAGFSDNEIKYYVTSNSTCLNAGVSASELLSIAEDAAKKFWNTVPTSAMRLKKGGILTTTENLYLTGVLCVTDSVTSCDPATTIPKVNNIVIACNNETGKNFPNSNYYALSVPNHFSKKKIKGSVILINDSGNTQFDKLSRAEMVNILAHEFGHAVGLGHSKDEAALMFSRHFKSRNYLGQDDIDGISYLYPNKLHGCSGILGTIKNIDDQEGPWNFLALLVFSMLATMMALRLTKKFTSKDLATRQAIIRSGTTAP